MFYSITEDFKLASSTIVPKGPGRALKFIDDVGKKIANLKNNPLSVDQAVLIAKAIEAIKEKCKTKNRIYRILYFLKSKFNCCSNAYKLEKLSKSIFAELSKVVESGKEDDISHLRIPNILSNLDIVNNRDNPYELFSFPHKNLIKKDGLFKDIGYLFYSELLNTYLANPNKCKNYETKRGVAPVYLDPSKEAIRLLKEDEILELEEKYTQIKSKSSSNTAKSNIITMAYMIRNNMVPPKEALQVKFIQTKFDASTN